MAIDGVPDDVLLGVVQLLPTRDVVSCLGVCKRWRTVILDAKWKDIYEASAGKAEEEGEGEGRGGGARRTARFVANRQPALPAPHASWPDTGARCSVPQSGSAGEPIDEWMRTILCAGLHLRWRKEPIWSSTLLYTSLVCCAEEPGTEGRGHLARHSTLCGRGGSLEHRHSRLLNRRETGFSAPLPVQLSIQYHYGIGGRGGVETADSNAADSSRIRTDASISAATTSTGTLPSSASSYSTSDESRIANLLHRAVQGANEWTLLRRPSVRPARDAAHENDRKRVPFITDVRVSNKYALVRASPIEPPCVIALNVRQQHTMWPSVQFRAANGGMNASRTAWLETGILSPESVDARPPKWGGPMAIAAPLIVACVNETIFYWEIIPREDMRTRREHVRPNGNNVPGVPGERRFQPGREQENRGGIVQLSNACFLVGKAQAKWLAEYGRNPVYPLNDTVVNRDDCIICLECAALRARPPSMNPPHDTTAECHVHPRTRRWRVVSASAAGRVLEYTMYQKSADVHGCDNNDSDGHANGQGSRGGYLPIEVERCSTFDLDVSRDGVPTALEVFPDSERVAIGTSFGTVQILSIVPDPSSVAGEKSFLLQESFSTLPTPVRYYYTIRHRLCLFLYSVFYDVLVCVCVRANAYVYAVVYVDDRSVRFPFVCALSMAT